MASLDWAALADNLTREGLVLVLEMPEAFDLIDQIYAAGECAVKVAGEAQEAIEKQVNDAKNEAEDEMQDDGDE
jgi:hypothetical protein